METNEPSKNAAQSVIVDSLVTWAKGLIQALLPLIDARSLVLIAGSGVGAWLAFPASMQPMIASAFQLVLAFVFAVGVAHLVRKILLSGKFDLATYAEKALDGNIAAAMVFVSVLMFVGFLIFSVVSAILPR